MVSRGVGDLAAAAAVPSIYTASLGTGGGATDGPTTSTMLDVLQKVPQVSRLLTVVVREVTHSSLNSGGFLWTV